MLRVPVLAVLAVLAATLTACGKPRPPELPMTGPISTQPVVEVAPLSPEVLREARKRPPPPRDVSEIWTLLPPEIQGGWQGEPIREVPQPRVPAPWHGIGVRYYASAKAVQQPWYTFENDERRLNEDRRKVISTYLVWNDRTGEGLILNPIASDIAFIIETAKKQAGVRWLHVIDSHTELKATRPLPGPEQVRWEEGLEFTGRQVLHFRDGDRVYREKGEVFDADGVATALGATTIRRGLAEPEITRSGKLLVFRTSLDSPMWCFLEVQWGPFRFDGNWDNE